MPQRRSGTGDGGRPPPVEPWSGVRDATVPGNPAPQLAQSFADITSVDEDCLTLNVTMPEAQGIRRPVMVWLHGGGGTNGSAAAYDAHRLAIAGDVVVVAPNFRLGVFGCFGYPGLTDGGTFGLQDQQTVLRWVQREIAQFGGDPANVTLFGESYGALMIAAHLVSPASAGLFHRAVLQRAGTVMGSTRRTLSSPVFRRPRRCGARGPSWTDSAPPPRPSAVGSRREVIPSRRSRSSGAFR